VQAFQRITTAIRAANIEVATVWCFATDGDSNYSDYYPGDSFVDWWAIDLFSANAFSKPITAQFMTDADLANKPVMIGETTPRYVGAGDDADWDHWFSIYYNFIEAHPGVKATCYINWNWTEYPQWSDWGDARIDQNDYIKVKYIHELRKGLYYHGSKEQVTRALFDYDDNDAPAVVNLVHHSVDDNGLANVSWQRSNDISEIAHYSIYKDGELLIYLTDTSYIDATSSAGDKYSIQVSATDRAGNESDLTGPVEFEIPDTVSKTINGDFDTSLDYWVLDNYNGAEATASFLEGEARISITHSTGTGWHSQLIQLLKVIKGQQYVMEMTAKASQNVPATMILQQDEAPYSIHIWKDITITTSDSTFVSNPLIMSVNEAANVGVFLGEIPDGDQVYISRIKLYEIASGPNHHTENLSPISNAGTDRTYTSLSEDIVIDGSASYDEDGTIGSYYWEQLSGEHLLTIKNNNESQTFVTDLRGGVYLFRLTVTDNEGSKAHDELEINIEPQVGIEEIPGTIERIYPNPSLSHINIILRPDTHMNTLTHVSLVDVSGRMVQEFTNEKMQLNPGKNMISIEPTSLPKGIYILVLNGTILRSHQVIVD
jgi:hypothetical protein